MNTEVGNGLVKCWDRGLEFENKAVAQLLNVASLPFIKPYVAAMPDCHWGMGCTVGSVIPSIGAVMPAAVGVDIGCGMMACLTPLKGPAGIPGKEGYLSGLFEAISKAVPHGRTNNGGKGDRGAWGVVPEDISKIWKDLWYENEINLPDNKRVFGRHPQALSKNAEAHLGTLGTGNHFIELSVDELDRVWIVLHSGSRGFGNRIGTYFTGLAKKLCEAWFVQLPDKDLAYLPEGTQEYEDYLKAVRIAQTYAWKNREIMMGRVWNAIGLTGTKPIETVHCHHNYLRHEKHFGKNVILTRKGAVKADVGDKVIIPGSMGARTYIAEGLGNVNSFKSCSHGAGRAMSRTQAEKTITLEQHITATEGVVCDKTKGTLDESPAAYKDIDLVMAAQTDLVKPIHILKQVLCVKGLSD